MDVFKADASNNLLGEDPLGRVSINLGLRIQEFNDVDGGTTGGRDIRNKGEDVSSLDGTECYTLMKRYSVKDRVSVD